MIENSDIQVVLGTGPLGTAVIRDLADKGRRVRAVNRSGTAEVPGAVQVVAGDISDAGSARKICEGAQTIFLCAKPPYTAWPEMFPPIMNGAIDAAVATGAKLIYADNLYTPMALCQDLSRRICPLQQRGEKGGPEPKWPRS
ncbi:MAG: NAD(P)H-binding protein [Anaerolineales bacterium]